MEVKKSQQKMTVTVQPRIDAEITAINIGSKNGSKMQLRRLKCLRWKQKRNVNRNKACMIQRLFPCFNTSLIWKFTSIPESWMIHSSNILIQNHKESTQKKNKAKQQRNAHIFFMCVALPSILRHSPLKSAKRNKFFFINS